MKILLLVNSHLPAIGGRELVVHNLAIQYARAGHDVRVGGMAGVWSDRKVRFPYPVTRFPSLRLMPESSLQFATVLHALTHRYDVVHAHATYASGYVAVQMRNVFNAPVVITPHGEDINVVPHIGFGQRLDPVQRPKIEWTVRHADGTTAISQTVHASLLDAGAPADRIHDIANGVDTERFNRPVKPGIAEQYGFARGTMLVTSIGNYHPVKGHELLVEAAAIAHQHGAKIGVVIVGERSEAFCRTVAEKGYGEFVRFAGVLPVPDWASEKEDLLADLLAASQVYVSSSVGEGAEGLSLSLLEGMAAGACPVVSDISGNRDMVQDRVNGRVFPPGDPHALATALGELAAAPTERERLAVAARATTQRFSWRAVAAQYIELYQLLIDARASRVRSKTA
jgi:teichuronic acid biosynthesis glycosyltransferase TuaC